MNKRQFRKTIKLVTIIATSVMVILVCVIIGQYIQLAGLKKRSSDLTSQISNLTAYKQELTSGINTRKSSAYIEMQAREQLGMIKEGESLYIYN